MLFLPQPSSAQRHLIPPSFWAAHCDSRYNEQILTQFELTMITKHTHCRRKQQWEDIVVVGSSEVDNIAVSVFVQACLF